MGRGEDVGQVWRQLRAWGQVCRQEFLSLTQGPSACLRTSPNPQLPSWGAAAAAAAVYGTAGFIVSIRLHQEEIRPGQPPLGPPRMVFVFALGGHSRLSTSPQ